MRKAGVILLAGLVVGVICSSPAHAAGDPSVAALQVALRAKNVYTGEVDGVEGPLTDRAIRVFQRRRGLTVDGIAGRRTRAALGRPWQRRPGRRLLRTGARGWDVAALQFQLSWHGFPLGPFDGIYGPRTEGSVMSFQRWASLGVDGAAGGATIAALRRPRSRVPIRIERPVAAPVSSRFGPRESRFHAGVDLAAPRGSPVRAAAAGMVSFAGWMDGFGRLITIDHRSETTTFYAHLSRFSVRPGEHVSGGERIGYVGSSGVLVSGPHLHFEVRVRYASVDPLPALRR